MLRRVAAVATSVLLAIGVSCAALVYPLSSVWLILGLALYAAVLWRYPGIELPAVLALLPLLDFSPWSGWILLNEFDLAVAVTLAVHLLRPQAARSPLPLSRPARWAIAAAAASFVASTSIALWPLPGVDANALYAPYNGFSSLRQLKGFGWALALLPILVASAAEPREVDRNFTLGMLLGLTATIGIVLWQRIVFAGLLDFAEAYRVEGPFPELHTGGGDVHAYLVTAMPFAVAWVAQRPVARRMAPGAVLFVLSTYAIGVTFTRGAYVGYAAAFIMLCLALARHRSPSPDQRFARIATVTMLTVIGLVVLLPILSGSFMEARLAGTQAEATTRTRHWARAIAMMADNVPTKLFGMGLGTFPSTFLFKHPEDASASFSYERNGDNGYLRLGSGRPLFLDQRVDIAPHKTYTLSLDLRSSDPSATLAAMLCEKSIQFSFRCQSTSLPAGATGGWTHQEAGLASEALGSGAWSLARPIALSLANTRGGSVVDVDNVRLSDETGRDLVVNGDFSRGGARWLFAADDHLPWHIFNLWVEILFEQGGLGVLAVASLILLAVRRAALAMWGGDLYAGVLLAAMAGFLAVGLTESLFDGPRVTTLFWVVVFATFTRRHGAARIQDYTSGTTRAERHAGPTEGLDVAPLQQDRCRPALQSEGYLRGHRPEGLER